MKDNDTWTLKKLPPGKSRSQLVYRIKYLSDGYVKLLKSRFVILGNHQEVGVNYNVTFAPVATYCLAFFLLSLFLKIAKSASNGYS